MDIIRSRTYFSNCFSEHQKKKEIEKETTIYCSEWKRKRLKALQSPTSVTPVDLSDGFASRWENQNNKEVDEIPEFSLFLLSQCHFHIDGVLHLLVLEGTWLTASAHIITAVIGSGVLSLAWAIAQLGWVAGPVILMAFSFITLFTSTLLADSYRSPDPVTGKRNYTYMDAVRANLGGRRVFLCGLAQYANLVGVTIGYTITASISMVAVKRSNCFHKHGHQDKCHISNYTYMTIFACIQIILSQIPNFHKLSWLSVLAAVMSFAYSSIGLGLSIAKVAGFGFYEPFWLIDFANVCIAVHLIGAYQVFCQPIFSFGERNCHQRWPENKFITREHAINIPFYGVYYLNLFRLAWRTLYVILTAVLAMIFPFFNDFLGLIGAAAFWPLTVYFPIEMYIARTRMPKFSFTWTWLKILSFACLLVSLVAAAGSVEGLTNSLKTYKPFQSEQ
ncbi:hypothetical protein GH714_003931 [Hevea brasiliensis]|uniref:Amino acid transporter transmembrane domain-containing protein n=1 Tax=Hevea brasiliensis TaxID=3981 RepID=A0A6A6NFK0_HEVBR|nr:hypothetical protein GH714_003931 [Hevea brasiliensis]